jgi:hypothetical protein
MPTDSAQLLWSDVLRQVGWETEDALERALTRLEGSAQQGRMRPAEVDELRSLLGQLRDVGSASRQVASVLEGSLYGLTRRMALDAEIQALMAERLPRFRRQRRSCIRHLTRLEVMADEALVRVFLEALLLWALERTAGDIELCLEPVQAAGRGQLLCRFRHRADVRRRSRFGGPAHWGANWQLACQCARALGWALRSGDADGIAWVTVEFDCVPQEALPAMEAVELTGAAEAAALAQIRASLRPAQLVHAMGKDRHGPV